jgi:hypothetical protein
VRLAELPRTTSFRLAMLFLLLFGTAALLLCGFLYWQTKDFLSEREDETLVTEQAAFDGLDASDLRELLAAHVVMDPHLQRPLTLFGPAGERVAGSPVGPPVLAQPSDQPFTFTQQRNGRPVYFRGLIRHLPDRQYLLGAQDMTSIRGFSNLLLESCLWGGLATVLLGLTGAAIAGADALRRIEDVTRAI